MLISPAFAQTAGQAASTQETLTGLLPMILMFVVLWFLMIRPQMKRAKDQKNMIEALQKGDEVVTQGGLAGRVVKVHDNFVTLEVAQAKDGPVEVQIQKAAVGAQLPKGTLKSL